MSVGVMTVGVMSVGEITVGVMTVGVMRRPQINSRQSPYTFTCKIVHRIGMSATERTPKDK
jgi:hypothetical protein